MFIQPSLSPKVIPGPPIFDAHTITKLTAQLSSTTSSSSGGAAGALNSVIGTITSTVAGGSSSSTSFSAFNGVISTTQLYTENAHKLKKYRERAHFGPNGLFAYCCQNYIMVVDTESMQWIQSLDAHKATTTSVQWCPLANKKGMDERGNSHILASGDKKGVIILWDVKTAKRTCVLLEDVGTKKSIISLKWIDNGITNLLSLTNGGVMTMWNTKTRQKLWSKTLPHPIMAISINPFAKNSACMPSENGAIYFTNDLNINRAPENIEKKLEVRAVKDKSGILQPSLRDFVFSPHVHNQLYLVTRREISVYDLELRQTVVGKSLACGRSEFRRIFLSPHNPDLLFSLHEDGTIAAWEWSAENKRFQSTFCDIVRGSKHGADRPGLLYGVAFSSVKPNVLGAVSADGKVWSWEYNGLTAPAPKTGKWYLQGLLESTSSTVSSMQVSPFGDEVAVGTSTGTLLVYDLVSGSMKVKHDMFNSPVRGIRWYSSYQVICFSSKQIAQNSFVNNLILVNLLTGQHIYLRKDKEKDDSYIRGIRLSDSRKYLIVLPKDRHVEVWALDPVPKVIRILPVSQVTALEWCPHKPERQSLVEGKPAAKPEHFFFTSADGSLHFYRVEQNQVFEDKKQPKIFSHNQISALAWKDSFLVSGDTVGNLNVFEINNKKARNITTYRGLIRRIQFSPVDHNVIVLFAEGDFAIYDLDSGNRVAQSPSTIKADAVDYTRDNHPIIVTNTGSVIVYDGTLQNSNSSIAFHKKVEPIKTPALLPSQYAHYLRSLMDNSALQQTSITTEEGYRNCFGIFVNEDCKSQPLDYQMRLLSGLIPDDLQQQLANPDLKTPDRCLLVAKFFSDDHAVRFWTLASKFLKNYGAKYNEKKGAPKKTQETSEYPSNEDLLIDEGAPTIPKHKRKMSVVQELYDDTDFLDEFDPTTYRSDFPALFDLLRDNESVKLDEMAILKTHDESIRKSQNPGAPDLFGLVAQNGAILNQKNQAVKLLLETPPTHSQVHLNYLHACVIAASHSEEHFKQTIQFVSSNLISLRNERDLMYGVEFLCLIGEGFKACKILQDFDRWEKSARLAKSILPEHESRFILTRWANHLANIGKQLKAVGVWLSLGLFAEVLDLLYKNELFDLAALFAIACEEYKVPLYDKQLVIPTDLVKPLSESTLKEGSSFSPEPSAIIVKEADVGQLLYNIFNRYAQFLEGVGNTTLQEAHKAKAQQIKEKYNLKIEEAQPMTVTIPSTPQNGEGSEEPIPAATPVVSQGPVEVTSEESLSPGTAGGWEQV